MLFLFLYDLLKTAAMCPAEILETTQIAQCMQKLERYLLVPVFYRLPIDIVDSEDQPL